MNRRVTSHIVLLEYIVVYSRSAIQICFIVRFPYIARKEFSKEIFFCQIKNEEEAKKSRLYHTIACQFITMLTYQFIADKYQMQSTQKSNNRFIMKYNQRFMQLQDCRHLLCSIVTYRYIAPQNLNVLYFHHIAQCISIII